MGRRGLGWGSSWLGRSADLPVACRGLSWGLKEALLALRRGESPAQEKDTHEPGVCVVVGR